MCYVAIWKLKRIGDIGAMQLMVDVKGLQEYLLDMPNKALLSPSDMVMMMMMMMIMM